MGDVVHKSIIVTSAIPASLQEAQVEAYRLFGRRVSPVIISGVNGYQSFFIAPSGSKEGWEAEEQHEKTRNILIQWINDQRYEDGSCPFEWVEVQYCNISEVPNKILRSSNERG